MSLERVTSYVAECDAEPNRSDDCHYSIEASDTVRQEAINEIREKGWSYNRDGVVRCPACRNGKNGRPRIR